MLYVTELTPEPEKDLPTGINSVGGVAVFSRYILPQKYNIQPFNRGLSTIGPTSENEYRLYIDIADNQDFVGATSYVTNFVFLNEKITVDHAFKSTGTKYIRMQAENENGVTSKIVKYQILIIILKYFIDEPEIKLNGPQANTVTVKSPTNSYTASTSPSNDEIVKRVIEIEEGDESVCELIANELIDRWGREQKTVTGDINLTVTLDFKEKIRLINNSINFDEVMILQKKTHDVAESKTTIKAGDIILDDSELLSRILDDLKG